MAATRRPVVVPRGTPNVLVTSHQAEGRADRPRRRDRPHRRRRCQRRRCQRRAQPRAVRAALRRLPGEGRRRGRRGGRARARGRGHPEGVVGGANSESGEIATALDSVANARLAPYGSVAAGQYSASPRQLQRPASVGSAWTEVTNTPYDADDPGYRDPIFSNSSGGAGYVAGRITGLAAGNGVRVRRRRQRRRLPQDRQQEPGAGDDSWAADHRRHPVAVDRRPASTTPPTTPSGTPPARRTPAAPATPVPASTGWRTPERRHVRRRPTGSAAPSSRAAASTSSASTGGYVFAATTRGIWRHSTSRRRHAGSAGRSVLMPNPARDTDITTPYKNIVNDVAIDPERRRVCWPNIAWRSGDTVQRLLPLDRRRRDRAFTGQPARRHQPEGHRQRRVRLLRRRHASSTPSSSHRPAQRGRQAATPCSTASTCPTTARVDGPWNQIADYQQARQQRLRAQAANGGKGYGPGVQAWYNNFIEVDPADADHVYLGLEEVFETEQRRLHLDHARPVLELLLPLLEHPRRRQNTCPETTHSDQHSIAIGGGARLRRQRRWRLHAARERQHGERERPRDRLAQPEAGPAHPAVLLGGRRHGPRAATATPSPAGCRTTAARCCVPQDDRHRDGLARSAATAATSSSTRDDGCNILDEYVYLTLWVTKNCGQTDGTEERRVRPVGARREPAVHRAVPARSAGRRTPPTAASERWVAGGNSIWYARQGVRLHRERGGRRPESRAGEAATTLGDGGRMIVGLDAVATGRAEGLVRRTSSTRPGAASSNCNSTGFDARRRHQLRRHLERAGHDWAAEPLPRCGLHRPAATPPAARCTWRSTATSALHRVARARACSTSLKGVLGQGFIGGDEWRRLDRHLGEHARRAGSPTC